MSQLFTLLGRIRLTGLPQATRGLSGATIGARRLTADVGALASEFQGAGLSAGSLISAIGQLAGVGSIAKGLAVAVDQFADFERRLAFVRKTTGLTSQEVTALGNELLVLASTEKGLTFDGLSNAAIIAGQLGIKGSANILAFAETVEKLALTSVLSSEQAANALARLSNVFQLPIDNVNKLSSAITALAANTTATESDIVESTRRIAGAAHTIGVTIEQTVAISATLRDVGANIEVGATAVVQTMLALGRRSKEFAELLGVTETEFLELFEETPIKALEKVLRVLGSLGKVQATRALRDLKLQGTRVSGTLLQLSGGLDKLLRNVALSSEAFESGNATQREFEIQTATLSSSVTRLSETYSALGTRIGATTSGPLKGFIDGLAQIPGSLVDAERRIDKFGFEVAERLDGLKKKTNMQGGQAGIGWSDAFLEQAGFTLGSQLDSVITAATVTGLAGLAIAGPIGGIAGAIAGGIAQPLAVGIATANIRVEIAKVSIKNIKLAEQLEAIKRLKPLIQGQINDLGEVELKPIKDLTKASDAEFKKLQDATKQRKQEQAAGGGTGEARREEARQIGATITALEEEVSRRAEISRQLEKSGLNASKLDVIRRNEGPGGLTAAELDAAKNEEALNSAKERLKEAKKLEQENRKQGRGLEKFDDLQQKLIEARKDLNNEQKGTVPIQEQVDRGLEKELEKIKSLADLIRENNDLRAEAAQGPPSPVDQQVENAERENKALKENRKIRESIAQIDRRLAGDLTAEEMAVVANQRRLSVKREILSVTEKIKDLEREETGVRTPEEEELFRKQQELGNKELDKRQREFFKEFTGQGLTPLERRQRKQEQAENVFKSVLSEATSRIAARDEAIARFTSERFGASEFINAIQDAAFEDDDINRGDQAIIDEIEASKVQALEIEKRVSGILAGSVLRIQAGI